MDWRVNVIKMLVISYLIYRFNIISVKLPASYFFTYQQIDSTVSMERQNTQNKQSIQNKKNKLGGITLLKFKTYYKVTVINAARYWQKNRHIDEKETLIHCKWECELVQTIWKTVWRFLKQLKIELPYDPSIPLLGIYPEKNIIRKDTRTPNVHWSTIYNSQDMEAT